MLESCRILASSSKKLHQDVQSADQEHGKSGSQVHQGEKWGETGLNLCRHGLTKISHLLIIIDWGVSWWWWVIWGLLCQLKFYVYWVLGLGRRATLHQQQALKKGVPEVSRSRLYQNKRKTWAERPTLPLDRCRKAHDLRCFGARHLHSGAPKG